MSLRFGTAGVRAPVGPASNQMNVGNVTKFTSAVAMWLAEEAAASPTHHARTYPQDPVKGIGDVFHDDAAPLRVAVGYDARYGSHAFATATAEVFAGAGFEVFLMPMPAPPNSSPGSSALGISMAAFRSPHLTTPLRITATKSTATTAGSLSTPARVASKLFMME